MSTHYSHLTQANRITIQALKQNNMGDREIARQIGFHHSTITREVNRGKLPGAASKGYQAAVAQALAKARRASAGKARRKLGNDLQSPLWKRVLEGLRRHWSPEQIAGTLKRTNRINGEENSVSTPPAKPLFVSHETIYCAIYAMPRGALRTELVELLRQAHKRRLPRSRGVARKAVLPNMKNIVLRPPEVAARIVPGHWEGDLIKGMMNRSSVGTLVERTSRYTMLVKLDGGTAPDIYEGFRRRLKSVPESLRQTLTYDQGSEMALHEQLSATLSMEIFFCDAHSPWQRGSNENANGLIREFLPKGMDLSRVSHQELTAIEHSLNHRPRKILDYQTPHQVFSQLKRDHILGVALQA
jgi:transposase, IS30 family